MQVGRCRAEGFQARGRLEGPQGIQVDGNTAIRRCSSLSMTYAYGKNFWLFNSSAVAQYSGQRGLVLWGSGESSF
jgi:hypothetical protein